MTGAPLPHAPTAAERDSSQEWRAKLITRFSWALFLGGTPLVAYTIVSVSVAPTTRAAFWLLLGISIGSALARRLDFRVRGLVMVMALLCPERRSRSARWTRPCPSIACPPRS
jgi:hypothetical protein